MRYDLYRSTALTAAAAAAVTLLPVLLWPRFLVLSGSGIFLVLSVGELAVETP